MQDNEQEMYEENQYTFPAFGISFCLAFIETFNKVR